MRGRVVRAMKQKMFVISREADASDNSIEKFQVLGSVGNVSKIEKNKKKAPIKLANLELYCNNGSAC